jgi:hypothetical protein
MYFDIIPYTDDELAALSTIQMKLLRTAQKSKDELDKQLEEDELNYKLLLASNNMIFSTLYEDKCAELEKERDRQVNILREQLVYNMTLNEPTTDDELGGSHLGSTDESSGYLVDYSLSYIERYTLVRDYYMTIEDPSERLALYTADTTAQDYLGSYYVSLYNYLKQYS